MTKQTTEKLFAKKEYKFPQPIEKCTQGYISWGTDNLYPNWLIYLYYTSAVHQGIINMKTFFTIAEGIKPTANERVDKILDKIQLILDATSKSLEITDSFYWAVSLTPDKKKVLNVRYMPFEWVRYDENGIDFLVCEDWSDKKRKESAKPWKSSYERIKNVKGETKFLLQFKVSPMQMLIGGKGRKLTENYYPAVPYTGALKSICTDIEIVDWSLSEIVNNFSLGAILSLNSGKPKTEQDRNAITDRVIDESTGADVAGGVLIFYHNGKDNAPEVLYLNGNQLHERYLSLSEDVRENIMRGHSIMSGQLFGFTSDGNFNASTIDWEYFILKKNYFAVRQDQITQAIEQVLKIESLDSTEIEWNELELPEQSSEMPMLIATPPVKMRKHKHEEEGKDMTEDVIAAFAEIGRPKSECNIIASEELNLEVQFKEFMSSVKEKFADLSAVQLQVLTLIADGNSFGAISDALGIDYTDLAKIYLELKNAEQLNEKGEINTAGYRTVIQSDVSKMAIEYTYELRPDAPPLKPGGQSRPFCAALIQNDRIYTREEINTISQRLFGDQNQVWNYRGGWYHNPDTDMNTPWCRHYWQQNLIYKR